MSKSKSEIKPFYVYTNKDKLYIKSINEKREKLASNINSYCANIDSSNKIHICAVDLYGRLIHFSNNKDSWKKNIIGKAFNNIKVIKEMRLFILDNYLNILTLEESPLDEDLYRVTHFNFSTSNYKVNKFNINNIVKDDEQIYKVSIDSLSNIILEYKPFQSNTRNHTENIKLVFNAKSRTWLTSNTLLRCQNNYSKYNTTIEDDIFDYCYGINYKL